MRIALVSLLGVLAAGAGLASQSASPAAPPASASPPRPQSQTPVFRAGIDLLTVDATALDASGRQVTDLQPSEFVVEVDGDARKVASAEYLRLVDPRRPMLTMAERARAAAKVAAPVEEPYYSSNNKGAPSGRLIMLLIDQGNIRAGAGRQAMESAKKFVDTLQPEDRVGVVAIPGPGELVDFTVDHDKVREALLRVHGIAQPPQRRFNLSLTESMALYQNSDSQMVIDVLTRECGVGLGAVEAERCERDVEQEAAEIMSHIRRQAEDSIRGMRQVLQALGAVEGPKEVVLISEGLILEHLTGDVDDLAQVATDSRATLDVMLLDVSRFDAAQNRLPTTPRQDRALEEQGLEALAGLARGQFFRINATAEYAFDRITNAMAGYYLIGVEAQPADRDGKRHKVSVKVTRKGVTVQSRRGFLSGLSTRAGSSPSDSVSRAIRSPLPSNDVPMRLSTWTYKEPGTARVRLLLAVEVERLADQPLEYLTGLALIDRNGKAVLPTVEPRHLVAAEHDPGVATFNAAMTIEPGSYRLRVAMADSEGRIGSVERRVDAFQMDEASLSIGDLLLGVLGDDARQALAPSVEPRVAGGSMGAMMEVYGPLERLKALEGTMDIMRPDQEAALISLPMLIAPGRSPEMATVQGVLNTATLPPGAYVAKATIREAGKPQGHLTRPFRVLPAAAGTVTSGPTANMPPEFVAALVGGLRVFDRKELLSPAALGFAYTAAESRGAAAKGALGEARAGQLGSAAMTALADGDQALAAFLKGLDLLSQGQPDRAGTQFQTAMQQAPQFVPARTYLGVAMAERAKHREAAGLFQGGAVAGPPVLARLAGEEWLKAGDGALAIVPLEQAAGQISPDLRTQHALGLAYLLGNRPADAVAPLSKVLAAEPANREALLAGIYAVYSRHLVGANPESLAADRLLISRWSKAYASTGAPFQALVTAWTRYIENVK